MNQHVLRFDTAQIGPLRDLVRRFSPLKASVADIVQFRAVVDANYVVQNLIYRARHPDRGATAIEELIKATVIDVFAPRWLETEMASAIQQAAANTGVSQAVLWTRWLEFRPLLKWDNSLREPGAESAGCCDPKDHPYVMLARKIGAHGILSKDAHITRMGGHLLTLDFVLSARSYARAAVTDVSIRVLGTVVPAAAVMTLLDLLRRTARAVSTLPSAAKTLLLICAAIAAVHPTSRRWIADRCAEGLAAMEPAWCGLQELVTTLAATGTEAQTNAALHLHEATRVIRSKRDGTVVTARVRRRRDRLATAKTAAPATSNLGRR